MTLYLRLDRGPARALRPGEWLAFDAAQRRALLAERPVVRAFTWKTAFYRGAQLRIKNGLYEQRKTQQSHDTTVTTLVVRTEQENQDYMAPASP